MKSGTGKLAPGAARPGAVSQALARDRLGVTAVLAFRARYESGGRSPGDCRTVVRPRPALASFACASLYS